MNQYEVNIIVRVQHVIECPQHSVEFQSWGYHEITRRICGEFEAVA
jgi:hypothetical protein